MHIEHRHTTLGRALVDRVELGERDPSLLNLPFPVASIPILNPIVTLLVGGSNPSTSSKPAQTTPAAPAPTSAAPPANSSPASSGGSSGGSSSGGTSSGGSSSGGSSSGGSSSGGSSSGGSSTGGSTSGGSSTDPGGGDTSGTPATGGDPSTPGGTPTSPSGADPSTSSTSPDDPASSDTTSPTSTSGSTTSGASGTNPNLGSDNSGGTFETSSTSLTSGSNGSAGGSNPDDTSASSPGKGSVSGSHSTGANGLPLPTGGANGGSNGNGSNGGNNTVDSGNAAKSHNTTGIIVGVIVAVLIIFIGVLYLGRKRQRARRNERRFKWWFARSHVGQTYGDRNSTEVLAVAPEPRSARSSFATTFDQSHASINGSFTIPPMPPPMAEIGRADGTAPTLLIEVAKYSPEANNARFSIGSVGSNNSQYLVVNHRDSMQTGEVSTPMSVRPFSPSESFAFPKPPDPAGDRTSAYSRPASIANTLTMKSPTGSTFAKGEIPPVPPPPTFPAPIFVQPNPFGADPFSPNPFADTQAQSNPFADSQSAPALPGTAAGEFSAIEYIRRPFHPNLPDEIRVQPDDAVRVLQAFDDGWVLVEKADGEPGRGLIPLDCLREPGQPLPAFFAAKRVSRYSAASGSSESPFAFSAF